MKFKNEELATRKPVLLTLPGRDPEVTLEVRGLPYGVDTDFNKIWPAPKVKTRTVHSKGGANEVPVLDDPDRRAEEQEREVASIFYKVYLAIKDDKNVSFDNNPVDKESVKQLVAEVSRFGLSSGDVSLIIAAIAKASNLDEETWENIEEHFA